MHELAKVLLLTEHAEQLRADNPMARHAADVRERDRARRAAARTQARNDRPESWFGFLPRLTGWPYSR
jgi:hypothetical protein